MNGPIGEKASRDTWPQEVRIARISFQLSSNLVFSLNYLYFGELRSINGQYTSLTSIGLSPVANLVSILVYLVPNQGGLKDPWWVPADLCCLLNEPRKLTTWQPLYGRYWQLELRKSPATNWLNRFNSPFEKKRAEMYLYFIDMEVRSN